MKLLFVWPNKDAFGFKPVGISLLLGVAQKLGWETKLFDTTKFDFGFMNDTESREKAKVFKPVDLSPFGHTKKKLNLKKTLTEFLQKFNPDCIAISVLSDEVLIASQINSIAKEVLPNIPIIWGGKYPTLQPQKTLLYYGADFACVGEGIGAFENFLSAIAGKSKIDLYSISNIWVKTNKGIIKNDPRPLIQNLDEMPFVNWDLFEIAHFYKPYDGKVYLSGDHMLNWGCPYHCSYCINHFLHEKLYKHSFFMRRYSTERIITELKFLKEKYRLEFFKFHDEDFLMRSTENLRELSDAYKREINLPFVIETNPKSVTKEKAKLLKNMNCVSVSLGIETGDPELRKKVLNRVDTEQDIINAFTVLNDFSIRTNAFIMLGIPYETRKTYEATINLLKKANVQHPNAGFFFPFEGTELRELSINEGFFTSDNNSEEIYTQNKPALKLTNLTEEELIEMRDVFILYVKLPENYKYYIRRSEKNDTLGRKLRKNLLKIYDKTVWDKNGWYADDGQEETYLKELNDIIHNSGPI